MITIKRKLSVQVVAQGRKTIRTASSVEFDQPETPRPVGRIPRIARLMALAITFDEMLRTGEAADMIELARRGHVTQPRMSQIMSLNMLAPDIQEALLLLPPETSGRSFLHEKRLRPIASTLNWAEQRTAWKQVLVEKEDAEDETSRLSE